LIQRQILKSRRLVCLIFSVSLALRAAVAVGRHILAVAAVLAAHRDKPFI